MSAPQIPSVLGERVQDLFGLERAPKNLGELLAAFAEQARDLTREQLCCTGASRHEVRIAARITYVHCVMDGLLLALLAGEPAEVRSVSPGSSDAVTIRVSGEGIEFEPREAVVSFGVSKTKDLPVVEAVCPYINAFGTMADYERWVVATPKAATIPLPLGEAFAMAQATVERIRQVS